MKTFHEEIPDLCQDALTDQLFDEHSIFFDIETTGFSPANSTLYMIGCARRKSNRICIEQFFAEKPEEEAEILATFFRCCHHIPPSLRLTVWDSTFLT